MRRPPSRWGYLANLFVIPPRRGGGGGTASDRQPGWAPIHRRV